MADPLSRRRRFTLNSTGSGEFGTFFRDPLGKYGRLQGTLAARWLPKARGDDYETQVSLRGEPHNQRRSRSTNCSRWDLIAIRHYGCVVIPACRTGKRVMRRSGRNYLLVNAETDKIVYENGIFTLKVGPFLDTGRTYEARIRIFWFAEMAVGHGGAGKDSRARRGGYCKLLCSEYGKEFALWQNSFFTTVTK